MKDRRMKNQVLLASPPDAALRSFEEILRREGFRVQSVESGQKAIQVIKAHQLDAIILDYRTPFFRKETGASHSRTLEAITDVSPFLPLVLVCSPTDALDHATSLMADLVLTYPVRTSAFLEAVDTVLEETLAERAQRKAADLVARGSYPARVSLRTVYSS